MSFLGFNKKLLLLGLSLRLLLVSTPTIAYGNTASCAETISQIGAEKNAPKISKLRKRLNHLAAAAVIITALMWPNWGLYHDMKARLQGKKHIGYGLYFDKEEVLRYLHPDELELLKDIQKNELKIATLLTKKLRLSYDEKYTGKDIKYFIPKARNATAFFHPKVPERGVCRHQICILSATLDSLGIENKMQESSAIDGEAGHLWIYLPKHHIVLDPTNDLVEDYDAFTNKILPMINQIITDEDWKPEWHERGLDRKKIEDGDTEWSSFNFYPFTE